MKESIDSRELITLAGSGTPLRGTYHRIRAGKPALGSDEPKRIGILFLNSLSLPRTATGDSAVYWADAFAGDGYPCFRLDLPGLGDSEGQIEGDFLDFLNAGGYASTIAAVSRELLERYQLSGLVFQGHCAGAVSAIHAAAASKECRGLVLMDPYFHLNQAIRPKVRQELSHWARRSTVGKFLSNLYDHARDLYLHLTRNALPKNANLILLNRWKEVATTGLPILLLKAPGLKSPGTKPRVGEFDYLKYILDQAGRKGQVAVELVEETDHSFANRPGRAAVRQVAGKWLQKLFPPPGDRTLAVDPAAAIPSYTETDPKNQKHCQPA